MCGRGCDETVANVLLRLETLAKIAVPTRLPNRMKTVTLRDRNRKSVCPQYFDRYTWCTHCIVVTSLICILPPPLAKSGLFSAGKDFHSVTKMKTPVAFIELYWGRNEIQGDAICAKS